jgi:uncharacterized iron-regulated membrane protein
MKIANFDKTVYSFHKWFGLVAGVFILMLSLTGIVLLFDDETDAALNADLVKVTSASTKLPLDSLLTNIKAKYPAATINFTKLTTNEPDRATMTALSVGRERLWVHQNPYTGTIIGERPFDGVFVKKILGIHEHLTLGETGHAILLIVGLSLIGLVLTGVWYYRKSLLSVFKIGIRTKTNYLRYSDLHKLIGVSSFVFLFIMGVTGSFMHWEKVERLFGDGPPRREESKSEPLKAAELNIDIDKALAEASAQIKGFEPVMLNYPKSKDEPLTIRGNRPETNRLLDKFGTVLKIDVASGKIIAIEHSEEADTEHKIEGFMEQAHFGKFGGLFTKLLYALGSLGLSVMSISGFVIWWKKNK